MYNKSVTLKKTEKKVDPSIWQQKRDKKRHSSYKFSIKWPKTFKNFDEFLPVGFKRRFQKDSDSKSVNVPRAENVKFATERMSYLIIK